MFRGDSSELIRLLLFKVEHFIAQLDQGSANLG
jgi:hypothetical protein